MTPVPRRAVPAGPAVLLAVLLVSGCSFRGSVSAATPSRSPSTSTSTGSTTVAAGTTSASDTSPGTVPTTSATAGAPAGRCHTSELTGSLGAETAGAGQRYATLALRNTGSHSCTVHGFGGLGLAGVGGAVLPSKQLRTGGPATTVLLAPGATAHSDLHWGAVPGPGDSASGDCQPSPTTLRVIPPDETDPLSVAWTFGPVCEGGTIEQHPYTS